MFIIAILVVICVANYYKQTHTHIDVKQDDGKLYGCMIYEHEPLWIIAVVIVSAISTLLMEGLRKRRARASACTTGSAPPPPWEREETDA